MFTNCDIFDVVMFRYIFLHSSVQLTLNRCKYDQQQQREQFYVFFARLWGTLVFEGPDCSEQAIRAREFLC